MQDNSLNEHLSTSRNHPFPGHVFIPHVLPDIHTSRRTGSSRVFVKRWCARVKMTKRSVRKAGSSIIEPSRWVTEPLSQSPHRPPDRRLQQPNSADRNRGSRLPICRKPSNSHHFAPRRKNISSVSAKNASAARVVSTTPHEKTTIFGGFLIHFFGSLYTLTINLLHNSSLLHPTLIRH